MSDKKLVVNSVENEQVRAMRLPAGGLRYTCCAQCDAGDYDPVKEMVWCGQYEHWYRGSSGCSHGPNH